MMPKQGAQFHFELPGSVQGFLGRGEGSIENKSKSALGDHTPKLTSSRGESALVASFAPSRHCEDVRESWLRVVVLTKDLSRSNYRGAVNR